MTAVETEGTTTLQKGFVGQNVPRKEDRRLVEGQGVFFDDVKRHGMGYLHFVRSPYPHARILSIDVSAALELPGVYGTLTGDEVAILTDPFFQIAAEPGGSDQGLRARRRQGAIRRRARRRGRRGDARARPRRRRARDGRLRAARRRRRRAQGPLEADAPVLHEECGGNMTYEGVWEWGDVDKAFAEADHVVKICELHFDRFNSTPLELDGALVEFNRGTGSGRSRRTTSSPGSR